ncbi:hypothetical protein NPIL_71121 [Nephila pilipes]|uniref:Uncharacterized protein n=1 Tax=Nephila pilipes TaxID=299642 RepID=A0A8X6MUK5_NEPPI|nr:hypothetical protein NPIL_71121 [Nephila pilipes]
MEASPTSVRTQAADSKTHFAIDNILHSRRVGFHLWLPPFLEVRTNRISRLPHNRLLRRLFLQGTRNRILHSLSGMGVTRYDTGGALTRPEYFPGGGEIASRLPGHVPFRLKQRMSSSEKASQWFRESRKTPALIQALIRLDPCHSLTLTKATFPNNKLGNFWNLSLLTVVSPSGGSVSLRGRNWKRADRLAEPFRISGSLIRRGALLRLIDPYLNREVFASDVIYVIPRRSIYLSIHNWKSVIQTG